MDIYFVDWTGVEIPQKDLHGTYTACFGCWRFTPSPGLEEDSILLFVQMARERLITIVDIRHTRYVPVPPGQRPVRRL